MRSAKFWLALVVLLTAAVAVAAQRRGAPPRGPVPAPAPAVDVDAALASAVPDLDRRVGRFKVETMPFNSTVLSTRERQMIEQLVIACRSLERIFWRQSDPEGLELFNALLRHPSPVARNLRRYLTINGSRWDLVSDNRPFVGMMTMPPGHSMYPPDLTRAEIERYVAAHPARKAEIYSPYTLVRRQGQDLVGRPYHEEFKSFLTDAAAALRQAAALSDDPAFANFLRLRADALATDDYYASDVAWVDLKDPKFDLIFAPYETYLDDVLGVKTSYGAAVLIRNDIETRNLAKFQQWVADIQDALPLAAADRPSVRGHVTPMEVMDAPFRAGDLRHGYQAVADNLPNDPRIHQDKGTKQIFFKNFMDVRVKDVILPLASRILTEAPAGRVSADGYFASTVMHEIAHGLGPAYARPNGGKVDIREAIGAAYSPLEEAKADVVGMFGLKWLVDRDVLPKDRLEEYYASYVAGLIRTARFGAGEAHGRAEVMEFSYLAEQAAVKDSGLRYSIDYATMPGAVERLARELLEQEATGDRARTDAWFAKYGTMPATLRLALGGVDDVPVDVDPLFSFLERFE